MLKRRAFLTGLLAGATTPAWAPPLLRDTMPPDREYRVRGRQPIAAVELPEIAVGSPVWFLQVNCFEGLPAAAVGYEFGRCEVTVKGLFAGCFLAATYQQGIDDMLARMSVGFAIRAERKEDIEVKLYGALALLCKPEIKITEMAR